MKIKAIAVRVKNKFYTLIKKTKYYETKYGVKVYNRPKGSAVEYDTLVLSGDMLYLGVDGLKDEYTSTGKTILQSPHRVLIESSKSGNLNGCDYIVRERLGSLDGRDCLYYTDEYHLTSYKNLTKALETDYSPIKVYEVKGKFYIADGKHRAAALALDNKMIRCVKIELPIQTLDYMKHIYSFMIRSEKEYSKNIALLNSIFRKYGINLND